MFTGLIKSTARIKRKVRKSSEVVLEISDFSDKDIASEIKDGDSVSINGVCLTAEQIRDCCVSFFVSQVTLKETTLGKLRVGDIVNVELALRFGDRLGGHIFDGHIRDIGRVRRVIRRGKTLWIEIACRKIQFREKDSVAVDGISLTVQRCGRNWFAVSVIPETIKRTNLQYIRVGKEVNLQ